MCLKGVSRNLNVLFNHIPHFGSDYLGITHGSADNVISQKCNAMQEMNA